MNEITTNAATSIVAAPTPLDAVNPAVAYLAGLSAGSRPAQLGALKTIAALITGNTDTDPLALPWHALTYAHTSAIRAALLERYAPATVNRQRAALIGVLKCARRLGLMSADQCATACDIAPAKGSRLIAGRALDSGEIAALINACIADPTLAGQRDAALIGCMYPAGMRRDEVARLTLANFDVATARLVVLGKGNKERELFLRNGARAAMLDWLAARAAVAADIPALAEPHAPLFFSLSNNAYGRPMTGQGIAYMLQQRASQGRVAAFSPHDLRRTTATLMLEAGVDVAVTAKHLGHASPTTTTRYDRRDSRALADAAARLHLPYTSKGN